HTPLSSRKLRMLKRLLVLTVAALLGVSARAAGQQPPIPVTAAGVSICGTQVLPPAMLPPAGSGPVLWQIAPCFEKQGNLSLVDVQTYLYYMQIQQKRSRPTDGIWTPYDDAIEQILRDDFKRLWGLGFLDDLSIEKTDYAFSNGVIGEVVTYHMEERQRVKIVDYDGSKKVERSKIDEALKMQNVELRLDTFLDPATIRKVETIVRDLM